LLRASAIQKKVSFSIRLSYHCRQAGRRAAIRSPSMTREEQGAGKAMSRRMQQRMKMLQVASAVAEGVETSRYAGLIGSAGGSVLKDAPARMLESLHARYGSVHRPERAPYGTNGYVLYRVAADGRTEFLCASTPFFGQQIPLAWASGSDAQRLASLLECRSMYAPDAQPIDAGAYLADGGVVRFGNKGERVCVPTLN
jgi:hypothetical protein